MGPPRIPKGLIWLADVPPKERQALMAAMAAAQRARVSKAVDQALEDVSDPTQAELAKLPEKERQELRLQLVENLDQAERDSSAAAAAAEQASVSKAVDKALEKLPEKIRKDVRLRYLENLDPADRAIAVPVLTMQSSESTSFKLTFATWGMVAATIGLVIATIVLAVITAKHHP
jgi:DNA-directed RNA polymerase specialized sigma24 family protein